MIISIGIDIVEVYRIRETLARTPRFAERVFTEKEREYCDGKGAAAAQSYAARFAAKEAFLKALKTGWRGKITWQDMEILNNAQGVPSLTIYGEARILLKNLQANKIHLSISHTTDHAVAQVILENLSEHPAYTGYSDKI
jgi:holo-[acyl-carrier protein] synthase